jgi:hypothetical protein
VVFSVSRIARKKKFAARSRFLPHLSRKNSSQSLIIYYRRVIEQAEKPFDLI